MGPQKKAARAVGAGAASTKHLQSHDSTSRVGVQAGTIPDWLGPILKGLRRNDGVFKTKGGKRGRFKPERAPTMEESAGHFNGADLKVGGYLMAIGSSTTRLAVIDLDDHGGTLGWGEMCRRADAVTEQLAKHGLRAARFRSSGGHGIHLWVYWDTEQDARSVRMLLKQCVQDAGLEVKAGVAEVFPKQDTIPEGGCGSAVFWPVERLDEGDWPPSEAVPIKVKEPPPKRLLVAAAGGDMALLRLALGAIPNEGLGQPYGEGGEFGWLTVGMALHAASGGSAEGLGLWHEWSGRSPKYDAADVDRRWSSFKPGGGITAATILKEAAKYGFNEYQARLQILAPQFQKLFPVQDDAAVKAPHQTALPAALHFDARPITLAALRTPVPVRKFVIEPHLPRGVLTEFSGAHGISKSTLAADQAFAISTGHPWCGLPTTTGRVVFASREDGRDEILRRVQARLGSINQQDRKAAEKAICQNLTILGREETAGLSFTSKTFGACSVRREAIDLVVERCRDAVLIVLETASRLHGGDELNEDLAQLADALEQIASRTGAAVMLIRHVSKAAARDKAVDSYAGRGGGALSDAARSVLVLVQLTPEQAREQGIALEGPIIALHHAKASYSAPAAPLYFVRLPGPVLRQVIAPNLSEALGGRLLAYMREQGKGLSLRYLQKACASHKVPQRHIEQTLVNLERAGRVKAVEVSQRGGYIAWEPTP